MSGRSTRVQLPPSMDMPHRNMMLGIQQVVMLGELAVNRVLDNLDPQG
ncbi:hypothetical protein NHU87_02985 [Pseudomonas mandelii]|nr:hypothetical protein [Pseudomonas mandelii]MCO8309617.1 hypothetical protein [Pseudomonas mandelii]